MSRLRETNFQGIPAWQWDDGPIFVGKEARTNAVGYGKAVMYLEEWGIYAKLAQDQELAKAQLKKLQEIS